MAYQMRMYKLTVRYNPLRKALLAGLFPYSPVHMQAELINTFIHFLHEQLLLKE